MKTESCGLDLPPLRTAVKGIGWPGILADDGAHLLALCFQLDRSQWWAPDVLRDQQLQQLRALISHAVKTTAFFKQGDYRAWPHVTDDRAWSSFQELPVMTRRQVQKLGFELQTAALPADHGDIREGYTSGSTGMPLRYWSTPLANAFWDAIVMRDHFWHRRDFSARHAFIRGPESVEIAPTWGSPSSSLFAVGESVVLSSKLTTAEKAKALIEFDPDYLLTQPVNIRALASIALEGNLPLPRLREVRTVGETVTDSLRELVFAAWGVSVVDIYSSSECGMLALQCPLSGDYHSQSEAVILEVIDVNGKACEPGETGRVIATPLHNFAMPLIRYDTGDFAEVGAPCRCGRGLPTLTRILGRRRNRLHLPDGNTTWPQLSSMSWHALAPAIERFQLCQEKNFSLVFRYEAAAPLAAESLTRIQAALADQLRFALPLSFEHVEQLPESQAGKLEDFVSSVEDEHEAGS